jgi:hypothetical protein
LSGATAYSLVITIAAVIVAGMVVRLLWNASPAEDQPRPDVTTGDGGLSLPLYWVFTLLAVSTPLASFVLTLKLRVRPQGFGILVFMAMGLFSSLALPLSFARFVGRVNLENFWSYLELRSKMRRSSIILLWMGTIAFILIAGVTTRLSGS